MRDLSDYISARANAIDASGIRKVFDLAAKLKDPINLSIGLPDFDVPEVIKQAAIDSIHAGHNRYTQTQGIAPLRERLHRDLSAEMGRDVGEVIITSGVSGGLLLAMMALIDPGDEVICLDPYFVAYKHILTMSGGKIVAVDSYPDFRFHADRVEKAITPRSKVLLLNSPSNPTGIVMTEAEVTSAVDIARRHGLVIITDEIYEPFLYAADKSKLPSPARDFDRTIILRGFSKSHAMTGWRLGYAAGPVEIISQMAKLQQYTFVCAPAPLQYAAMAALDVNMDAAVEKYRQKRDIVFEGLSKKFELIKPEGAFYIFPKVPGGRSATEFATAAIEKNVLLIPGGVFSHRDTHLRISYATTDEKLRQGVEILNSL